MSSTRTRQEQLETTLSLHARAFFARGLDWLVHSQEANVPFMCDHTNCTWLLIKDSANWVYNLSLYACHILAQKATDGLSKLTRDPVPAHQRDHVCVSFI